MVIVETTVKVSTILLQNKTWIKCGNMKLCRKKTGLNGLKKTLIILIIYICTLSVEQSELFLKAYFLDEANSVKPET